MQTIYGMASTLLSGVTWYEHKILRYNICIMGNGTSRMCPNSATASFNVVQKHQYWIYDIRIPYLCCDLGVCMPLSFI